MRWNDSDIVKGLSEMEFLQTTGDSLASVCMYFLQSEVQRLMRQTYTNTYDRTSR
jgi:hypothetical protein